MAEPESEVPNLLEKNKDSLQSRYQYSSVEYQGETWDLSHLNPYAFKFELSAELKVDVVVFFACHCFTRGEEDGDDELPDEDWYIDDHEARLYDPYRYELSKKFLPRLIQELAERRITSTGKGNFATIEVTEQSGEKVPYMVFFDVVKDSARRRRMFLYVQSAYVNESMTNRMKEGGKVSFRVLLKAKYEGRNIRS